MSLTHLSSNLPDPLWWSSTSHQHHITTSPKSPPPPPSDHPTTTTTTTNHHHPKDPLFEKPLTPSDVGKLNRLVIPKQHAEKHFPLPVDSNSVDQQKGLLLCFEDETGKAWRFRYSYWNSSQSYVLTKGWSRYVKEKRLDAGDVVLFERHRFDGDRLFIGWRRRVQPVQDSGCGGGGNGGNGGGGAQVNGWTTRVVYNAPFNYPSHHLPLSVPHPYQPACIHAGGVHDNVENNQRDMVASGNPRRVRLFGVNLECPDESEPSSQDGSSQSGQPHYQYYSNSNNLNHNMNINFSQMRYHQHQG